VHPDQVERGALENYWALVIPHNSLYFIAEHPGLEAAVRGFVERGGRVLHGPHCELAMKAFGIVEESVEFDCFDWRGEAVIPHGWSTVAFPEGESLGNYFQSGQTAVARTGFGAGDVISFGFQYGYSYSRCTMPIVPPNYGRREMHPIVLQKETPVRRLLGTSPSLPIAPIKGVEFARFGPRMVVVNHRASPIQIGGSWAREKLPQLPCAPGWIAAHSATLLELSNG
jgi:hypothetical protein